MLVKDFDIIRPLGQGSYGSVYLAKKNGTEESYALKVIDIRNLGKKERRSIMNEIRLLASTKHENIICYFQSFSDKGYLHIVTEFVDKGDLEGEIKQRRITDDHYEEDQIWKYFVQITMALKVIHSANIIHRDLKSANILIKSDGQIKLADFGVAKLLKKPSDTTRAKIGTPYYMSPEVWQGHPYNTASDIWSLGILLYEMCALRYPFEAPNPKDLGRKVVKGGFPELVRPVSKELLAVLTDLLVIDPLMRPPPEQILKIPIVAKKHMYIMNQYYYEPHARSGLKAAIALPKDLSSLNIDIQAMPSDGDDYRDYYSDDPFEFDRINEEDEDSPDSSDTESSDVESDSDYESEESDHRGTPNGDGDYWLPKLASSTKSSTTVQSGRLDIQKNMFKGFRSNQKQSYDNSPSFVKQTFQKKLPHLIDHTNTELSRSSSYSDQVLSRNSSSTTYYQAHTLDTSACSHEYIEAGQSSTTKLLTPKSIWSSARASDPRDSPTEHHEAKEYARDDEHDFLPRLSVKSVDKPVNWVKKDKHIRPLELPSNSDTESPMATPTSKISSKKPTGTYSMDKPSSRAPDMNASIKSRYPLLPDIPNTPTNNSARTQHSVQSQPLCGDRATSPGLTGASRNF